MEYADDSQPVDVDPGYEDEQGYDGDPGYDDGVAQPPDLSDALAQIKKIRGARGYDPELDPYDPEGEDYGEEVSPEEAAFEEAIDAAVQERVAPVVDAIEGERREREIHALAEQYPQLRDPETIQAVAADLDALAAAVGDETLRTAPPLVEKFLLAHIAAGAQAEPEQPQQQQQGLDPIETGAGPGGPPAKADPVESAYGSAFAGPKVDDWGFPVQ